MKDAKAYMMRVKTLNKHIENTLEDIRRTDDLVGKITSTLKDVVVGGTMESARN